MSENDGLTEKQQIRLSTWADGQGGVINSFFARRYLERNAAAREYVHKIKDARIQIRQALEDAALENIPERSLWDRVEKRIGEEERARLFLGDRKEGTAGRWVPREMVSQLKWGMAGALVAACATIVVGNFWSGALGLGAYQAAGNVREKEIARVQTVSEGRGEEPLFYSMAPRSENSVNGPGVFEVEWMKSRSGHVRVLRGPGGAPVIWVKKPRGDTGNQSIQLVEPRVPEALAVADR